MDLFEADVSIITLECFVFISMQYSQDWVTAIDGNCITTQNNKTRRVLRIYNVSMQLPVYVVTDNLKKSVRTVNCEQSTSCRCHKG